MGNILALGSKPDLAEYRGDLLNGHATEETLYARFFGFTENPFKGNPDPRFLFLSQNHQECLDSLLSGLKDGIGFISLLGESGTGKTILLNHLIHTLGEKIKPVFVSSYPDLKLGDVLRKIEGARGLPASTMRNPGDRPAKRGLNLNVDLTLVLDEAQVLPRETLKGLHAFAGISNHQSRLQVIFAGHPDFEWNLSSEGLQPLHDSIRIRCRLRPFSMKESAQYIEHRLILAGKNSSQVFTREALSFLCKDAEGIPQRINRLCENAFWLGFRHSQKRIDASLLKKAAHHVYLPKRTSFWVSLSGPNGWKKIFYLASVLLFFLLVFMMGRGQEALLSNGGRLSFTFGGMKSGKPVSALHAETMLNAGDASLSLESKSLSVQSESPAPFPPIPPPPGARKQELAKQASILPDQKYPAYRFPASTRGKKDIPALSKVTLTSEKPLQIHIENTGAPPAHHLEPLKTAGKIQPTRLISGEKKDGRFEAVAENQVQPIIVQAFASRTVDPGQTWKVYLKAIAGRGNLKNIFSVVDRGNSYPAMTRITGTDRKSLNGYIYLNTCQGEDFYILNTLTLTVWIQDTAGAFSEPAVFPLSLESATEPERPPRGVFVERNLGPVMVQWNRYRSFGG